VNIPVLLEPTPAGFRASTGAPLNLTAEAPTADEALAAIRRTYVEKQIAGAQVVALELPAPDPLIAAARRMAAAIAENPQVHDDFVTAMKEYRREREAEEDAAEAAAEEARKKATPQQEPAA
jgi:hypothetical protein